MDGSLSLFVSRPKEIPPILGERAKLTIGSGAFPLEVDDSVFDYASEGSKSSDEHVSFNLPIEKIGELTEKSGTLSINGKAVALSEAERSAIRDAIVEAREATNSR